MFTDCKSRSAFVNITINPRTGSGWQNANFAELAERYWAKVRKGGADTCWPWTASTTGTGLPYGQFRIPRNMNGGRQGSCYAHRMAWLLTHGAIPDGLKICHRCDNPICCNPTHLFLGTQADNLADCRQKGRMPAHRVRKLTVTQRAEIRHLRAAGHLVADLAKRYGVSKARISTLTFRHRRQSVVCPTSVPVVKDNRC